MKFYELTKEEAVLYAKGDDLEFESSRFGDMANGFVLLRYKNYNLACGLLVDGKIKNTVPSQRKLELKYI